MSEEKKTKKQDDRTLDNVAVASGNTEVVSRYGSANAEHIKGYTGIDYETGTRLNRGHKDVAKYKVNPEYKEQNIKQQSGYSAEIAKTSRDNAEHIINKSDKRTMRTDDHPNFGTNDTVYDHVETIGGQVIPGSGSQMKFVNNPNSLVDKIARGEGGGKNDLSRYLDAKLDLPSDQVEAVKEYCKNEVVRLREQANVLEKQGKPDLAAKKRTQADNYNKVGKNVRDSGITAEEAIFYREHPKLATARDMAKTAHRGGSEAAIYGAAIGGAISTAKNVVALIQGDKELQEVLYDTAVDTGKSALVGYGTGVAGSLVKSGMQQSGSGAIRQLSHTSLPALVVSATLELGASIKRYAKGEIDGLQFMEEIGEKGSGMLASGMMATLGQLAIPIPVVGALIGGMVGYTMSSLFYHSSLQAFKEAREAERRYQIVKAQCEEARRRMLEYQSELQALFDAHMTDIKIQLSDCFVCMDKAVDAGNMDAFAEAANNLGSLFGKNLQFKNMQEFEDFMLSDETLIL